MADLLPAWPLLLTFLAASFALAVTPGPGVFYIVTRSFSRGRASGLASVAGVALGNLGNAVGASLGLAAILAVSSVAFGVVKYAGAAYLVYLGVQAIRKPARHLGTNTAAVSAAAPRRIFLDGCAVALLNPKTALFFGAFLPQFMSADAAPVQQSMVLGSLFVGIAAITDTLYALTAAALAPMLNRRSGLDVGGRYLAGSALLGLGLFTAFSGSRNPGRS